MRFDDPDTGPIQELMNKSGGKWPIVDDPNAKIAYSVTGPPESFLVSPGGIVLAHIVGPITASRLEDHPQPGQAGRHDAQPRPRRLVGPGP